MLWQRVKTALLLAPFAIAVLLIGGPLLTGVALFLFLVINFEYFYFAAKFPRREAFFYTALSALPLLGALVAGDKGFLPGVFLALTALFVAELVQTEREVHDRTITESLQRAVLGFVYTGLFGSSIVLLVHHTPEGRWVLWSVLVVVLTDTFAYFGGRAFKGPKLAPRISPNKTFSGAATGALCAVLGGVGFGHLLGVPAQWGELAAVSLVVTMFSQCGDLMESYVKRLYGIKDISTLLPGHGGVLDRIDGLVFAAVPLLWIGPWVVR
jgi:phosphatidate cytidylyltransferase